MITAKCQSCGKYVHTGLIVGKKCMYCMSEVKQVETSYENSHMNKMLMTAESYLKEKRFTKALAVFDEAICLYPKYSVLYWGRLLAKNSCSSDVELIQKGIVLIDSPDYRVALHLASDKEKECYATINSVRDLIAEEITSKINFLERENLLSTNVIEKQKDYKKRIEELRETLETQISALDENERDIRNATADCNSFVEAEQTRLNQFVARAEKIRNEFASKTEVTTEDMNRYIQEISYYKTLCQTEANLIQSKSNIPSFSVIRDLQKVQKDLERKIDATIEELNKVTKEQNRLLTFIEQIHDKHKVARTDVEKGSFIRAISLIGKDVFNHITSKYIRFS